MLNNALDTLHKKTGTLLSRFDLFYIPIKNRDQRFTQFYYKNWFLLILLLRIQRLQHCHLVPEPVVQKQPAGLVHLEHTLLQ